MNWEQKIKQAQKEQEDLVKKSFYSDLEKAGEGSRGGRIIGHTKSGKPIYEGGDHHKIMQSSFNLSADHHIKAAKSLRAQKEKLKRDLAAGKYGQGATANSKLRELEKRAKIHEDVARIKSN